MFHSDLLKLPISRHGVLAEEFLPLPLLDLSFLRLLGKGILWTSWLFQ